MVARSESVFVASTLHIEFCMVVGRNVSITITITSFILGTN